MAAYVETREMHTSLVRQDDRWHGIAAQHRVSAQQLQLDVTVMPVQTARHHRYEASTLRAVCRSGWAAESLACKT